MLPKKKAKNGEDVKEVGVDVANPFPLPPFPNTVLAVFVGTVDNGELENGNAFDCPPPSPPPPSPPPKRLVLVLLIPPLGVKVVVEAVVAVVPTVNLASATVFDIVCG